MDPPLTFLQYVPVNAHFHISPFFYCILNKLPLIRIKVRTPSGVDLSLDKQLMASQPKEPVLSNKWRHIERGSHMTLFTQPVVVAVTIT